MSSDVIEQINAIGRHEKRTKCLTFGDRTNTNVTDNPIHNVAGVDYTANEENNLHLPVDVEQPENNHDVAILPIPIPDPPIVIDIEDNEAGQIKAIAEGIKEIPGMGNNEIQEMDKEIPGVEIQEIDKNIPEVEA